MPGTRKNDSLTNLTRLFLVGFLFVSCTILWFVPILLFLRHSKFTTFSFAPLFSLAVLTGILSIGTHFAAILNSAWNSYPYWLDDIQIRKALNCLSLPILITEILLLLFCPFRLVFLPVLTLGLLELAARHLTCRKAEKAARYLHTAADQPSASDTLFHQLSAVEKSDQQLEVLPFPYADKHLSEAAGTAELSSASADTLKFNSYNSTDSLPEEACGDEAEETEPPEDLLCTQNRFQNGDGTERIEGWFRVPFRENETISICHLSFCPPLKKTPVLQLIQISGNETQIKPTLIEPFGARIEVKRRVSSPRLSHPALNTPDLSVRICFFADETSDQEQS